MKNRNTKHAPCLKFNTALLLLALPLALHAAPASSSWGTYLKPFAADSLWNSRPIAPELGSFQIPKSSYFPTVASGAYSAGVFLSKESDGPMVIRARQGKPGVWDPDAESHRDSVTIPHWPADTMPATGSDGHADIVDPATGIIHSFWQLKKIDGEWVAALYAWMPIDGTGWADPAHYYQGARAVGIPAFAGMIRKHEVNDGEPVYKHALAMSLTFNGLSAKPAYIYPATSADGRGSQPNSGAIPEGALLMLPADYDTSRISSPALRKVAETLKQYGAYVVDRNDGTPFVIYVENGSGFRMSKLPWDNSVASELDRIRAALRQVVSAKGWIDGNGRKFEPKKNFNLLSMRGPWRAAGEAPGRFDTWTQAVSFPASARRQVQTKFIKGGFRQVEWAKPAPGAECRLTSIATGGARLRLRVQGNGDDKWLFDSGELGNGESRRFSCPADDTRIEIDAIGGTHGNSSVRGELVVAGE
jgi:hypothetical protein